MVHKPPLPDEDDLPSEVNGWVHAPASKRNGHVWTAADAPASVGVFGTLGDVRVHVFDDRVSGFCNKVTVYEQSVEADTLSGVPASAIASAVEKATDWMRRHAPGDWTHPDVVEAVFDPPVGFVLDRYYLERREHIVCYRQEGTESDVNLCGRPPDTDPSLETRAYLYVEAWRGSGNSTVALAPWLRAHDEEKHEVVDTPDECGLEVALKLAREWVREQTDAERDTPAAGQSGLGAWS